MIWLKHFLCFSRKFLVVEFHYKTLVQGYKGEELDTVGALLYEPAPDCPPTHYHIHWVSEWALGQTNKAGKDTWP